MPSTVTLVTVLVLLSRPNLTAINGIQPLGEDKRQAKTRRGDSHASMH